MKTDSLGRFAILFNPAVGDYLMTASMAGFVPAAPRELRRTPTDSTLVFNATLRKATGKSPPSGR